jgi:hypothetical protein
MHPSGSRYYPVINAQRMAAGIPGAQLQLIDTSSSFANPDVLRIGGEFVLGQQPTTARAQPATSMVVGWPAEDRYSSVSKDIALNADYVDWGSVSKRKMNPWVTADALSVLVKAGRRSP